MTMVNNSTRRRSITSHNKTSISLRDALTAMCNGAQIRDKSIHTDDVPPLSAHESSLSIWKDILQSNPMNISHYIPKPSQKFKSPLSNDLKLWLCSLDYSRGTNTLIYMTGDKDFIINNVNLFLINLNYDIVKSYVSHRLSKKNSHILDSTLPIRLRYKVSDRFRYLLTQEHRVKEWISNYDGISDTLCFFVYYLSRMNIYFTFPFETMRSYIKYINYIYKKEYLGGLMGSPRYNDILKYVTDNFDIEVLREYKFLDTRYYNIDAYRACEEIFPEDININSQLINGIHVSVLLNKYDKSLNLSREDIGPIHENLVVNQKIITYQNKIYLCWKNLYIDNSYLESALMYIRTWNIDPGRIHFRSKTSNIMDECGKILREIKDTGVNVQLDLDYENTPTHIMHDLMIHDVIMDDKLKMLIIYHKDELLKACL